MPSNQHFSVRTPLQLLVLMLAGALLGGAPAHAALTILINNVNAAGIGFNDATPAVPVGGNNGTTLGQQRLIAFSHAANLWGATLTSNQPVIINAQFSALSCSATTAVLGSAGATNYFANFPGAPRAGTWYPYAMANKLSGSYLGTANAPQINANFNLNLGAANCLAGTPFYLGLDGNHGTAVDFVVVLQHEMAHGLGFISTTNVDTGLFFGTPPNRFPSIYDHFLFGTAYGKSWAEMTQRERRASGTGATRLVWSGAGVTAGIPSTLRWGTAGMVVSGSGAGSVAGTYRVGEALFGQPLTGFALTAPLVLVKEQTVGAGEGCEAFNKQNSADVQGKMAVISRGVCPFIVKVKNAQNAGALAVLIRDNVGDGTAAPATLVGVDASINIPAARIYMSDGFFIAQQLINPATAAGTVIGSIGLLVNQYAGADPLGRALMYSPSPNQSGSSISHFEPVMTRNQLMEPAINVDLTQAVLPPFDLTLPLLLDLGW